jgi:EpsD family peptidyl-prolyl cis-trans isomerase
MAKRLMMVCLIAALGALVFVAGCSKKNKATEGEASKVAVKVGDWTMTRAELDQLIQSIPEGQRQKYQTPEGKADLADKLIEEEIYHQEGLKEGLQKDPKVREMVDKFERSAVVSEYYQREIKAKAYPTDAEVKEYFDSHQDKFEIQPVVRAQHIASADSMKLVGLMKRVEAGEPFTTLAHKYSEDEMTRADGGSLGYFNPGGYIKGIGYSKELSDAAFSMARGDMRIVKWEKGYSLLVVTEYRKGQVRPFDEVQAEIKETLAAQRVPDIQKQTLAKVRKNYAVTNFIADQVALTQKTAEELWNLAQNSSDSYQRLRYYEEIVSRYPNGEYAPEAQFMIGFVYAEELKSNPDASMAFRRVIDQYPNSEVAKTADWMINNLDKPLPDFEDLKDLQNKIETGAK